MAKMNDATPWLLPITISASGTRSNTFQTSGTWVDRDIQVSITTPAGSYDAYGGQLSITSTNLGITPTVTLSDANNKNISNYTVGARDTTYGYYVQINGSSSTGSKVITATRAAVTKSAAAGWINQNSGTQAIASANATATVSVNAGSGSTYVNIKAAGGGTLSGGGSWNLSHTLNYTDSTVDSATISLTDQTSGYRKIILNGDSLSKTVTRAAITAGYQPTTNAATQTVTISCPADNIYIKEGASTLAGGSLSKGDPSGGTLSLGTPTGGGLSSAAVSGGGLDNSAISTLTVQRANNDSSSIGGKNIYSVLSNSQTSEPTSGYFIAVTANASGSAVRADLSSVVTRAAYSRAVNLAAFSQTVTRAAVTDTQTAGYMDAGMQSLSSADTTVTLAASSKTVSLDQAQITVSYAGATKSLSKSQTVYIPITAATFANTATSGTTYEDISSTGPILISNDYLYINAGYTPARKISLARLVPDLEGLVQGDAAQMRAGYSLYDKDGKVITGTMQDSICTVAGGALSKGDATGGGLTTGTASGGALSGGGLTKGAGSVSYDKFTADGSNAGTNVTTNSTNTYTETEPTSGYYVGITITGSGTVNRAAVKLSKFSQKVNRAAFSQTVTRAAITDQHTAGYIPAKAATTVIDSANSTVELAAGSITVELASATIAASSLASNTATKHVYIPLKTANYSVSCSKTNPSVAYTKSTNMKSASTGTYYFTYGGTITSGTHKATATISAAGYVPTGNKSTTAEAIGVTESGNGTVYIPTSSVSAVGSVTTNPLVVAATNPVNLVTSMATTAYNVGLATMTNNAGTVAVKHNASEGYTGTLTNIADSNVSVSADVTLGGSQYISGVTIQSGDTGNFTVNDGTYTWTWKKDANDNVWVV